jgi:transmembrane sensor
MRLQRQIDELLAQRASEWFETLKHADKAERAAFLEWLSESKLHIQEFLEIVAVDRELARVDPQRDEDVDALIAQINPSVTSLPSQHRARQREDGRPTNNGRWMKFAALAAGVAGIAVLMLMLNGQFFISNPSVTTQVGEQRTIELPDTSVVQLNTDSKIRFDLGETERTVRLIHGEALFKVARDPQRPFRVRTRAGVIQAVGTQFNVYDRPEGTQVSVLDGRVKVTSNAGGPAQFLDGGQRALLKLNGSIELDRQSDVTRAVAWQQQRLVFDNASLEDIVQEFNRYNRSRRIELDNVPPGRHHYDGIFETTDPESFATLLAREPDLEVERKVGEIIVRPRGAIDAQQ